MTKTCKIFSICFLALQVTAAFSAPLYNYLCGGDEDGCDPSEPDTCICVASDPLNLDTCFTYESCVQPDPATKQCARGQIDEKTEARCLAVLWQSEPTPPCAHLNALPTPDICATECTSLLDCQPTRGR